MQITQAHPGPSVPIRPEQLDGNGTTICWLGSAGILVTSRGMRILIDPVLDCEEIGGRLLSEVERMPLLIAPPITPDQLPHIDAILYTHADADHLGVTTPAHLLHTGAIYHCTGFVGRELLKMGIPEDRIVAHPAEDIFSVGAVRVRMTLASHGWQVLQPEVYAWHYTLQDCTGYYLETPDGTIWDPGDSVLLPEHLQERTPDLLLMDYSADAFHFGREGALKLSNAHLGAQLVMFHWGTFERDLPCYSADPAEVVGHIEHPKRFHVLRAGEPFTLKKA